MELIIKHLPFIFVAIVVIITETLPYRRISEKVIENFGKGTFHRENNPELYTKPYITYEIKKIRVASYGFGSYLLGIALFFVLIFLGDTFMTTYGQSSLFILMAVLALVIYGMTKWIDNRKGKIILLSIFVFIAGIVYICSLFSFKITSITGKEQHVGISTINTNTVITTKSGSQWTPTDKKNVYYHVVKYGESLEYIFNDINLSLEKAQEQHFNILKKKGTGKFEIVSMKNYNVELQNHTFLYSGLYPGDTVYMLKYELEKFRLEKGM